MMTLTCPALPTEGALLKVWSRSGAGQSIPCKAQQGTTLAALHIVQSEKVK
jgi:hypothetical protein